jgi:hypothetical protein
VGKRGVILTLDFTSFACHVLASRVFDPQANSAKSFASVNHNFNV